ncbi:DUF4384 domain-containing protein [Sedimentitalea arenosa]|uniref:DUF4384 domain-containing protein n=1 Tax=Sedimentitalea arenosa TaxID=2798803 RepID=A0A8J7JDM4_9RHOB|nr:DUF4384 domain-containing protein [Arenibacterium arenosum]MBJ6372524.1 DUF4384 domain-containing protein [Arenibacterium arenosum]
MTGVARLWIGGLAGSAALHAALFGLWSATYRPQPVTPQDTPQGALDVQAYRLERIAAAERAPAADEVASVAPNATAAATIGPPRTTAVPVSTPPAQVTPSASPDAVRLDALGDQSAPASPVRATPDVVSVSPTEAVEVTGSVIAAPRIGITAVETTQVAPADADPAPANAIAAPDEKLARMDLPASQVAPLPAVGSAAAPLAVSAQRMTASLAFSGAGDDQIDPVSLAAFQSFMRPGDARNQSDDLRDGIGALLAQVPCARLQVLFDPDSATLKVNGHVPEDGLRAPVVSALRAELGTDIAVSDGMMILPRPQCDALGGIAEVGLPQSTDQITNPRLIGADTQARVLDFVKDDRLVFDLTAPDYDAYIYVDYFDADGNVLHLVPNDRTPHRRVAAKAQFHVGARSAEEDGLQLFIGPPYGQEIAVAFAATDPLYDGLRPVIEPAAPYLGWLKERVDNARARNPGFKGEWVYFLISTAER